MTKTKVTITLDEDVIKWVDQQASNAGISRSAYVEMALKFGATYTPKILEGLVKIKEDFKISKDAEVISKE